MPNKLDEIRTKLEPQLVQLGDQAPEINTVTMVAADAELLMAWAVIGHRVVNVLRKDIGEPESDHPPGFKQSVRVDYPLYSIGQRSP